jgi:heat shock protein HtpX
MLEAIESNRRRSWILVSLMGAILVTLGFVSGRAIDPQSGGMIGVAAALGVWGFLFALAVLQGDSILLASAGARRIEKPDAPLLFNVVEEMTLASGLGRMPEIYVIADDTPNAFAVGRRPERCAVAVTSGLLRILNRDELQGVIGHELGHLKNRDAAFMMLVGVMLGAIVLLSDLFLRSMVWGGGGRRSSRDEEDRGGQAQILFFILALALAILAPILAQLIYFACSRRREYLADASSARFTRYPEGLASALEKLSAAQNREVPVNRVLAPLYIVSPAEVMAAIGLMSTHPPSPERIRILRAMGGGAGYTEYEAAFRKTTGRSCLGPRTLASDTPQAARAASAEPETKEAAVQRSRDTVQLLGRLGNMILMTCPCGVGIKVPPGLGVDAVACPRCGRENAIPRAQGTPETVASPPPGAPPPVYRRRSREWESFQCSCGAAVQLSPVFEGSSITCPKCGRTTRIEG